MNEFKKIELLRFSWFITAFIGGSQLKDNMFIGLILLSVAIVIMVYTWGKQNALLNKEEQNGN